MAYFGLADTQRGQNDIADAAQNYLQAAAQPSCSDWLRRRAQLNAGEMFDLLNQRDKAIRAIRTRLAPAAATSPRPTPPIVTSKLLTPEDNSFYAKGRAAKADSARPACVYLAVL